MACGIDVVGVAPNGAPPDAGARPVSDASAEQAESGASSGSVDAAIEAGPCVACPTGAGAARTLCVQNACKTVRRVFVTRQVYSAKFDGAGGADSACQSAVSMAGLGGNWIAWISVDDGGQLTPQNRILDDANPYVLLDGTQIAPSSVWLKNKDYQVRVEHPIDVDEHALRIDSGEELVWTGTGEYGYASSEGTCEGWTTAAGDKVARVGSIRRTDSRLTAEDTMKCSSKLRLYCFEL